MHFCVFGNPSRLSWKPIVDIETLLESFNRICAISKPWWRDWWEALQPIKTRFPIEKQVFVFLQYRNHRTECLAIYSSCFIAWKLCSSSKLFWGVQTSRNQRLRNILIVRRMLQLYKNVFYLMILKIIPRQSFILFCLIYCEHFFKYLRL